MKRLSYAILILAALLPFGAVAAGISQLEQFTATTSPERAITQTVFGRAFRLTGQSSGCAQFSANGTLTSAGVSCGTGSGGSGFATTSADYWLTQQSTSGLAEGSNLFWTLARGLSSFIANLAATTSVKSITTLPSLSLPYSQLTGAPASAGYPFAVAGNATSTLTQFNGGLTAFASSTIGNGTAGLTVSGNSTTTGNGIFAGTLAVGTTSPSVGFSPGIVTGLNKNLVFSSDRDTDNFRGNIQFWNTTGETKSGLEWYDNAGESIAWLVAHDTNPLGVPGDHHHIEIETSDLTGHKQGRLTVQYGCDYDCLATFNQAEVQINRNTGQTNGNLLFNGGGQLRNTGPMQVIPNNGLNTKGFRIGTSTDGDIALDVTSGTELEILETTNVTGNGYVSGSVGIGTTSPSRQLTLEKSGSAGTVNGPQIFLRQNQTAINASSNTNLGEIYFGGADVLAGEEGFGAKIRAQASGFWNNTTNDYPADLLFFTQVDGGASGLLERMRITSAGNVGIGTTTPGSLLSVGDTAGINFSTATSSFSTTGGINLKSGCFAIAGACLSTGGGSSFAYPFPSNATSTLTQFNGGLTAYASSTIGNGTAGVTVSGNSTTTGNAYFAGNGLISGILSTARLIVTGIAAAFTPSAEGEIGIDTTDNQLKYFSGSAVRVLSPKIQSAFLLATSTLGTGTTTLKVSGYVDAVTVGKFGCTSSGSGTFVAVLGDSTSSTTPVVSGTSNTTSFTTLSSNNAFAAGEARWFAIGSVSGTVVNPSCSYERTTDPS